MTAPAARTLLAKLHAHGWHAVLTDGEGTVETSTHGDPRGDGTRPRLVVDTPCRSVAVRARHDDGRALRVVYETHKTTASGKPSWTRVMAWRGREDDERGPVQLAASELDQYVRGQCVLGLDGIEEAA